MIRIWEVHVFEYTRGEGNKLAFIQRFKDYDTAKRWQIDYNSQNKDIIVPPVYKMAAFPVEVVYPRDKFISELQEYSEEFWLHLSEMRSDGQDVDKYLAEVSEKELLEWL